MTKQLALALALSLSVIAVARAETPEERQACMDDAYKFCQTAIPDRERVFYCLVQNKGSISALCRSAITPFMAQEAAPAKKASKRPAKSVKNAKKSPVDINPRLSKP
jgi:hypothetical protein